MPTPDRSDLADEAADSTDDALGAGDGEHRRPDGVDDATVAAVGKLSEAIEWLERARGRLYDFHQMLGHLDFLMGDAAEQLRDSGHADWADLVEREVVGRNVLDGRWTFQILEEFEDLYYDAVREVERRVRDELMAGRRHVFEAELKAARRSVGRVGHDRLPRAAHDASVASEERARPTSTASEERARPTSTASSSVDVASSDS